MAIEEATASILKKIYFLFFLSEIITSHTPSIIGTASKTKS